MNRLLCCLISLSVGFQVFGQTTTPSPNVIAWGDNSLGQTNVPLSATNVVSLAAGVNHTIALCQDGRVLGWGKSPGANPPASATNIIAIAAAGDHSLGLRTDGTVLGWGGGGSFEFKPDPTQEPVSNLVAIATGFAFAMGLQADGQVVLWNLPTRTPRIPLSVSNVVAIGTAFSVNSLDESAMAQLKDGSVIIWDPFPGSRFQDTLPASWRIQNFVQGLPQLPSKVGAIIALTAGGKIKQIGFRATMGPPYPLTNAVKLTASSNFFATLKADGTLVAWGTSPLTNVPPYATNAVSLVAGGLHAAVITALPEPPRLLGPFTTPFGTEASVGSPIPLYIRAVGSQPLHYHWIVNGSPVANSDSPYPQLIAALNPKDIECQVIVSNPFGSVTSSVVKVTPRTVNIWGNQEPNLVNAPALLSNVTSVAAGPFHWLGLTPSGDVVAGGKNRDGQASVPPGLGTIIETAAGGDHSLALRLDGTIAAWGRNQDGQILVPADASNIVSVSAGWAHSLALRGDGKVLAWGHNGYGQTNVPADLAEVISVAAGYYHSMALCSDGTIRTWGLDAPVPASATGVVQISAGWDHCLALRADGSVIGWGDNSYGQTSIPASATGIVAISAGYYHDLALRSDGSLVTWGKPGHLISDLPQTNFFTGISAGEDFSIVIMAAQTPAVRAQRTRITGHSRATQILTASISGTPPLLLQWFHDGSAIAGATNRFLALDSVSVSDAGAYVLVVSNALGHAASQPVELTIAEAPYVLNSLSRRTVPIGEDISIEAVVTGAEPITYQWLWNGNPLTSDTNYSGVHSRILNLSNAQFAQSGIFSITVSNTMGSITRPIAKLTVSEIIAWGDNSAGQLDVPETATNILMIAAGDRHNLAVRADGEIIGWGDDTYGQASPPSSATNIMAVAADQNHSLALTADGKVLAWGDNSLGQCAVPSTLDTVVAVAAGNAHSLALKLDGSVVAWGSFGSTNLPSGLSNVIAVAAGDWKSVALQADGTAIRWMYADYAKQSATGVRAIAAGGDHALALRENGEIVAWGANYLGQAAVPEMNSLPKAITAGGDHSLALLEDSSIIAWGANYSGQTDVPAINQPVSAISAGGTHNLALIGKVRLPFRLSTPKAVTSGESTHVLLRIEGLSGAGETTIYQSCDCQNWTPLYTLPPSFGRIQIVDHQATTAGVRFYRVVERR